MGVDRGALRDERVHVGHGDEDLDAAVPEAFGDRQLVEIPGIVVVDRGPEQAAEVAHVRGRDRRWPVDDGELRQGVPGKLGLEALVEHRLPGDLLQVRPVVAALAGHGRSL